MLLRAHLFNTLNSIPVKNSRTEKDIKHNQLARRMTVNTHKIGDVTRGNWFRYEYRPGPARFVGKHAADPTAFGNAPLRVEIRGRLVLHSYGSMSNHVAGSEYCIQENIIVITLAIFHPDQDMGWLAHLQEYDGARAVYEVIIESAKAFGRAEELFGTPDEDYDWTKAIEAFVSAVCVSEHATFGGLYDLAKIAIEASKYRKG